MAGGLHLVLLAVVVLSVTSQGLGDDGSTTQESTKPEDQKESCVERREVASNVEEAEAAVDTKEVEAAGRTAAPKLVLVLAATHQVEGGKANDCFQSISVQRSRFSTKNYFYALS
ncbi:hypothetical protein GE061_011474 [Apolygus lucorum]|uniref:Secreted protein n=1 Tax=Apolygus lucorum TaxID=248454 RepID=A0A8S9XXE3_APOLU|nr:hypothetical protein GE061_011474 [Apolygus lucorum]